MADYYDDFKHEAWWKDNKQEGEHKAKDKQREDDEGSDRDDERDKEKEKSKKKKPKYRCMCLCWCHKSVDKADLKCSDCEKGKHRKRSGGSYLTNHPSPSSKHLC